LANRGFVFAVAAASSILVGFLVSWHSLILSPQLRDKDMRFWMQDCVQGQLYNKPNLMGRIANKLIQECTETDRWRQSVAAFFGQCQIDQHFATWLKQGNRFNFSRLVIMRDLYQIVKQKTQIPSFYVEETKEIIQNLQKDIPLADSHEQFMEKYFETYNHQPLATLPDGQCKDILTELQLQAGHYAGESSFFRALDWACEEKGYL
jgi:hypothetical protein